jgi:hypothetical protein
LFERNLRVDEREDMQSVRASQRVAARPSREVVRASYAHLQVSSDVFQRAQIVRSILIALHDEREIFIQKPI